LSNYYVDTSALAKRYLAERGSAWVLSWVEPPAGNIIIISELTAVELFSVLARRYREGALSSTNVAALQADFLFHLQNEYLTVPLDQVVLIRARQLVGQYPLRSLDAIQLACALHALTILQDTIIFVSGDNNLLSAAAYEGFTTDNPYNHP
jgi:hypothetical protein